MENNNQQDNNQQNDNKMNPNPNKKKGFNFYWIYGIIALVLIMTMFNPDFL